MTIANPESFNWLPRNSRPLTNMFTRSKKYQELLDHYATMARDGYDRRLGDRVTKAYSDQEALKFRDELKPLFKQFGIKSVLDYGGGGGHWAEKQVPEGGALTEYLSVETYHVFEPARDIDQRDQCDAVVCFDVMEHIYLADVGYVLNDIFSLARRLVVINVATYKANALLPTGENAHITCRPPQWWKGAVEVIAAAHPDLSIQLYASEAHSKATKFPLIQMAASNAADGFER